MKSNKKKNSSKAKPLKARRKKKQYFAFIRDGRLSKIAGSILLLLTLYTFIALISYLYTWQVDQSKIATMSWAELLGSTAALENSLGRLGGLLAHQLIFCWFGLASFIIPILMLFVSLKWLFQLKSMPFHKYLVYGIFIMSWLSVFLGFLFFSNAFAYGGGFGKTIVVWLNSFVGHFGTMAFLVCLLFIVGFFTFNINIDFNFPSFNFKLPKFKRPNFSWLKFKFPSQLKPAATNNQPVDGNTFEFKTLSPQKKTRPARKGNLLDVNESLSLEILNGEEEEKSNASKDPTTLIIEEDVALPFPELIKRQETPMDLHLNKSAVNEQGTHLTIDTIYDPTKDLADYKFPEIDFLEQYGKDEITIDRQQLDQYKDQIIETLLNYKIQITKIKATVGPTVTLYEIVPAPGVKISRIKNLEDDIALSLAALGIRIIAPMPGRGTIGIEVPNKKKQIVSMHTVIASDKFQSSKFDLPIALGKNISNEVYVTDLARLPHLLIAGATGQGKSVGLNAILVSLLYKKHPSQLKFVLVDPKKVELSLFNMIENHFLAKLPNEEEAIITDTRKVVTTLNALCMEMDDRYDLLKKATTKNIKEYNAKFTKRRLNPNNGHRYLPYIVLVIDEFADLMMTAGKEVEMPIARLAQLARAIGIHLIVATQRPSVNIITGTIKANFPGRIAFKVTSKIDSRTILDTGGADQLIGRGDMLLSINSEIVRLQCAFVDTPEVERIAEFIGSQRGYPDAFLLPEYLSEEEAALKGEVRVQDRDDLFEDAARLIVTHQSGSTSLIQRKMKLGYNRAGRIMDQLEMTGIVGPGKGSKPRDVYVTDMYALEQMLGNG